jgi:hypothetical protein
LKTKNKDGTMVSIKHYGQHPKVAALQEKLFREDLYYTRVYTLQLSFINVLYYSSILFYKCSGTLEDYLYSYDITHTYTCSHDITMQLHSRFNYNFYSARFSA